MIFDIFFHRNRSSHQRCSTEKRCSLNFRKIHRKIPVPESIFFKKVAGLRPATLLKKRLWHRWFSVNFAKFFKNIFFFYRTLLDDCFWRKQQQKITLSWVVLESTLLAQQVVNFEIALVFCVCWSLKTLMFTSYIFIVRNVEHVFIVSQFDIFDVDSSLSAFCYVIIKPCFGNIFYVAVFAGERKM